MDFIIGFPLFEGKDAIFVVVNLSTKHAHIIPSTPKFTTSKIALFSWCSLQRSMDEICNACV
jgi:hypothetical protein